MHASDVDEEHVKSALVRAKNAVRWIFIPRIHAALITMATNQRARLLTPVVRPRTIKPLLGAHPCSMLSQSSISTGACLDRAQSAISRPIKQNKNVIPETSHSVSEKHE